MFLSKIRADAVDDRSPWGDFWFEPVTVRSSAGVRVSADAALRLSAVYRAVHLLAETMASLPFCLYRQRDDKGRRERITDHWLYRLLAKKPNRWQNAFEWREMMQGHLALRGNGYNRIIANGGGEITELMPIHPDGVKIELLDSGNYRYQIKARDGSWDPVARGEIFHLRGLSSNGFLGLSPIECARESIGEGLAQQEFSARFFANDARPLGGWIEMPGKFKDQAAKEVWKESWQKAQAAENRGKTAVLEGGMKYHEVGMSNKDSQFTDARAAKIPDIARWFGVPPHLIGDLSRSTNNNIEQQSIEFVIYTMASWAERWEAAIEDQLIFDDEDLEVEFLFSNLLRGDHAARVAYNNGGITGGWLSRNEARIRENLDPLDGLDEPLQPLNMTPAGTPPKKPLPGNAAPEPDDPPPEDDENAKRLQALILVAARRVISKEIAAAARNAVRGENKMQEFYEKHRADVRESLNCSEVCADDWCMSQLADLLNCKDVGGLLGIWKQSAAAELAARVSADVCIKRK